MPYPERHGNHDGAGLLNFRDLGGTPTASSRLFSPDASGVPEMLTFLSPDDMETLIAGGLSDVIDLRTDYEVAGSPSPLRARPGVAYHHFNRPAVDEGATLAESADWDFESTMSAPRRRTTPRTRSS